MRHLLRRILAPLFGAGLFLNRGTRATSRQLPEHCFRNAVEIDAAAEWVRIVPIGAFPRHHDGPHEVTAEHVAQMAANFARSTTELLIDRDHESLFGSTRAAGWSDAVEAREDGLYMRYPAFTTSAQAEIDEREFRYFSPVYVLSSHDKQGNEVGARLLSVAITSMPYFDEGEIDPIGNRAGTGAPPTDTNPQPFMEREEIIQLLGLAEDATDEQIKEALKAKAQPEPEQPAPAANSKPKANAAAEDDPIAALSAQVAELTQKLAARETAETEADSKAKAETLVNSAIADGKLLPSEKRAYVNSAILDYDGTKAELDKRQKGSALPGRVMVNSGQRPERRASGRGHSYLDKALGGATT